MIPTTHDGYLLQAFTSPSSLTTSQANHLINTTMPRRATREYYDDDLYYSDADEYAPPPRRSMRERIIEDDVDYRRRKHRPPIDEFEQLHIRERLSPDRFRDEFVSRDRDTRRRPSRKIPREVERAELDFSDGDRGRDGGAYVERDWETDYNDDDFVPRRRGGWRPPSAPHVSDISDKEESIRPGRRWRKEVSPPGWDFEPHGSPPRRGPVKDNARYARRDSFGDGVPMRKESWQPPPASYTSEDEEFTRRYRRRARSPHASDYEIRDSSPPRSARAELDMEYGMGRDGFDVRAGSRSRSRSISRRREDDEEIRIQKDARGMRRRGQANPDEDNVRIRKRRISPAETPLARGAAWSPDRKGRDRYIGDGMYSCQCSAWIGLLIPYRLWTIPSASRT